MSRLPDVLAVTPGPKERLQFHLCLAKALKHMLISRYMNSPLRMPMCLKFGMHLSALLEQAPESFWGELIHAKSCFAATFSLWFTG